MALEDTTVIILPTEPTLTLIKVDRTLRNKFSVGSSIKSAIPGLTCFFK